MNFPINAIIPYRPFNIQETVYQFTKARNVNAEKRIKEIAFRPLNQEVTEFQSRCNKLITTIEIFEKEAPLLNSKETKKKALEISIKAIEELHKFMDMNFEKKLQNKTLIRDNIFLPDLGLNNPDKQYKAAKKLISNFWNHNNVKNSFNN
jgi:hypothetical protein